MLVHRQGDLRRRCVRAGAQGTLSREPDPQSRPAGRMLRAGGIVERCAVVRRISVPLQRGCEPPAPLDTRGLADCIVVAAARTWQPRRFRYRPPAEPALGTVPMENLR